MVLLSAACLLVSTAVFALDSTWVGGPTGSWTDAANWSAGVPQTASDTATLAVPVTIAIPASVTVKTLTVNAPATLTVASGATLAFSNGGGDVLVANATCLVDGAGDLTFSMNGTTGTDYANIKPATGVTLTLAARIIASGASGVEHNSAGTLLLTHPGNTFTGVIRISVANGTLSFSTPGALGSNAVRFDGNPSRYVYTGSGSATLALPVQIAAAGALFENAGAGTLTLSGAIAPASTGAKTLTFVGTTQTNLVTGGISNGSGLLNVVAGSGTLLLNGTVTDSTVTAGGGATLAVGAGAVFQNFALTGNAGSTVCLNPSSADDFAKTLPATNAINGAGVRFVLPAAATASTVTVPNLIRAANATLDIAAPELGTTRNTLLVQNLSAGPLPAWLTVNGQPAAYDAALGVIPVNASGSTYSLAALGSSVVPNDPTAAAVIDFAGTGGGITLAADPTTVFSLTQGHADNPAAVDLGGQTLAASVVAVSAAGNSLTLANGTLTSQSALTPPSGAVSLPALPTAPTVWFDLADAAAVTTDAAGRISLLANKGSLGAALDAAVPAGNLGPRYAPNAVAGLGVARSDGIEPPQGLATLGNAGITGAVARTVFVVTMRSPVSQNALYALYLGADANANESFALVERTYETSFVTMGNDLAGSISPGGHNVLTFITGLNGIPNAGEGFRNGVSLGTKTFALATADNPVRLLHRPIPAKAVSGPGEVAEALVFNYTLSNSDRAAVEAYLMQKWQISATRADTLLALRNDNPAAGLAVSAAVSDPYAAALGLAKSGPGPVTLGGQLAYSGSTLIQEGTLEIDTPEGLTNALAGIVVGPGSLVKSGPGGLALAKSNPYAGGTTVKSGTLLPGANGSLGFGAVGVQSNAALDIANAVINGGASFANPISIAGTGPDGLGALRNSHPRNDQPNAFKSVTLAADAAVYAKSRFDVRSGIIDFGGHSLTVNGGARFALTASSATNVAPSAALHIVGGELGLESSDLKGSAANSVNIAAGAGLILTNMAAPVQWGLQLAGGTYIRANIGGTATNLNRWVGPVALGAGTVRATVGDASSATFAGAVGGDGGLLKDGLGWLWLLNPANTYAGATVVTQGTLYAASAGSLGASALTVSAAGTLVARAASASSTDGWADAEIAAIADASVFATPGTSLGIDTVYEDFDFSADLPYIGLKKFGPRTLTLTGSAPDLGALAVYDGELDLSGTGIHNHHTYSVAVGASPASAPVAVLRLADTALNTDDPGYNRAGPILAVGSAASARGVLHVGESAAANGRLTVGDAAGSAGAVYQTASAVTNTGGSANDAAIGLSGYGYYRLDGGTLANKGSTQLGRNSGATGIFEQRGGALVLNPGTAPADGVIGDFYNGSLSTRAGVGVWLLSGGTFNLNGRSFTLGDWANVNTYSNGTGVLTLEHSAQADMGYLLLANRNGDAQAYVNLNGGTLTAGYFQKGGNNSAGNNAIAAIGFNGGTLRVPATGNAVSSLVRTGANNAPALLNAYAGGAVIETLGADGGVSLDLPLRAPSGFGVSGVTLTAAGAGYLAPPGVLFTGGNGTGATAVAEVNLGTGALTAIRVTSPGVGYTAAPTVALRGGGFTVTAAAAATLGASASGGLTKLGAGTLNLTSANTYTGPTVVSNGTLRLAAGGLTLTASTTITVAGGTLDLGGASLTNFRPVILESGRLVNGTVSALSFTKTGTGAATLTAQAVAPAPAATREAFIQSLGPLIWYDPSDTAPGNVVVDGSSRVSLLRNKGTLGATHDAIPYTGTGPLLLTGAASPSPLGAGVLQLDNATSALKTAADVPVTGTAPRTLVALLARDTTRSVVGIGSGADGQTFELGNDPSKTYISGIGAGRDTQFTANIPAVNQLTFIAAANGYNGNFVRGIQLWRSTGATLETLTATWTADLGTAAAPFSVGRRGAGTYRGKVAEVLLFNRILSSNEVAALKDALVAKYLAAPAGGSEAVPPVTVAEGTLRLAPSADAIAALGPAVWYDPSDAATVTTNAAGRVTALANKGMRGSAMDAGVRGGYQGALLVSAAGGSYSAAGRPMLKIDSNTTGLESAGHTGISGTAPRTLVAVLSRDEGGTTDQQATIALGNQTTTRAMFELTDRYAGNCFGNNGDDLSISPVLAAGSANVYMMDATATNILTGWRSGGLPGKVSKTLGGNWATADTPLCLGYRPNTHRDLFRGQVGEVLLFDRLLTDTERADVEDYLVNKWLRPGADNPFSGVTFDVAAGATLDLGGARGNLTVTGAGALANGTLGAGFVLSPAGDAAVGELALSGVTFAGATYRLTTSGNACDRLWVDGDLSGLTVVPATGAQITGNAFVIATGSITGKPALSGFPDKFSLIRMGDDLLLTSVKGALILLK
jgi:autotransporter-associated beta strand protein